jgi:RHS repeat-associated protein
MSPQILDDRDPYPRNRSDGHGADETCQVSRATDANGVQTASALYKAFGETRYTLGNLGTDYKFTGQREEASLGGIYFFQSRWFDPSLGRFMSPDSIVPTGSQGTQAWDRYAFVNNNPVRYNDPTGHFAVPLVAALVILVLLTGDTPRPEVPDFVTGFVEGAINAGIEVFANPLSGVSLGDPRVDFVVDVGSRIIDGIQGLVENSNGPSVNTNPVTPTQSPTPGGSTLTATSTASATVSATTSITVTPSLTLTPSMTLTPTITATASLTITPSTTSTPAPTIWPTPPYVTPTYPYDDEE